MDLAECKGFRLHTYRNLLIGVTSNTKCISNYSNTIGNGAEKSTYNIKEQQMIRTKERRHWNIGESLHTNNLASCAISNFTTSVEVENSKHGQRVQVYRADSAMEWKLGN